MGIEICCIPSFADIVIDGEYRTAIRFAVEPRGAAAIAPIVDAAAVALEGFAMSNVFEGTRFCIHTFGCQMNKHDSERVAGMLEGLGSLPVETIEEADIVVFMTCCVREAADTRLYGQVASMKNIPLRDGTPLDKRYIAVGGCIGQRDGDKLLAALPHLDVVFGTHNLGSLPGLLRRAIEQHGRAAEVIEGGAEFSSALPTVREHDWAAWLPITVGCNNFCSYCIVPYVRGREKSRPLDDIAAEARSYVEAGVKEITLLGQDAGLATGATFTASRGSRMFFGPWMPRASSGSASRRAIRRISPTRSSGCSPRCPRSCRRCTFPCSRARTASSRP